MKQLIVPIVILIIAMGVYPKPLLDIAEPAVLKIAELMQVTK